MAPGALKMRSQIKTKPQGGEVNMTHDELLKTWRGDDAFYVYLVERGTAGNRRILAKHPAIVDRFTRKRVVIRTLVQVGDRLIGYPATVKASSLRKAEPHEYPTPAELAELKKAVFRT